jgi:hypothetical protein
MNPPGPGRRVDPEDEEAPVRDPEGHLAQEDAARRTETFHQQAAIHPSGIGKCPRVDCEIWVGLGPSTTDRGEKAFPGMEPTRHRLFEPLMNARQGNPPSDLLSKGARKPRASRPIRWRFHQ